MSHEIKVQSRMTNLALLRRALDLMGCKVEENATVRGQKVALAADQSVGFQKQSDGTYAITGDPYYCPRDSVMRQYYGKDAELRQVVSEHYLLAKAQSDLRKAGFVLNTKSRKQKGKLFVYEAVKR